MTEKKKAKKPRRQYKDKDGNKLPSVTTILGAAMAKPGLIHWAAKVSAEATAEAIIDGFSSREEAINVGTKAPNSYRDHAAGLGTTAHALIEAHYAGEEVVIEGEDAAMLANCYERARKAIDERWIVEHSECALVSELGFGGTFDLICLDKANGNRILVDLKTGSYHPEAISQLAAYKQMWEEHNPTALIDGAAILHVPIKEDGYKVVTIGDESLRAGWSLFLAAFSIYRLLPQMVFDDA
jgi:hypothetical protein